MRPSIDSELKSPKMDKIEEKEIHEETSSSSSGDGSSYSESEESDDMFDEVFNEDEPPPIDNLN